MKRCAILFLLLLCLAGCSAHKENTQTFFAMDTVMYITVYGENEEATDECIKEINRLDALLSAQDEDSDIYKLNNAEGGYAEVNDETAEIISRSLKICEKTKGALDITIYPVTQAWGFNTKEYKVPSEEEFKAVLGLVDYKTVNVDGNIIKRPDGVCVDLGAVAKGYASEKIAGILKKADIESAIIYLGGNVQVIGSSQNGEPWRVAVQDPEDADGYAAVLSLEDSIAATSGGYNRYFEAGGKTYCHIFDPETGEPVENDLASVTVVCSDGIYADALSTALYVKGLNGAIDYWRNNRDFDAIFVTRDGNVLLTQGLDGKYEKTDQDRTYTIIN